VDEGEKQKNGSSPLESESQGYLPIGEKCIRIVK
jgi:hypothetical protein